MDDCRFRRFGRATVIFQQDDHFVLHRLHLTEWNIRVFDDEDLPGFSLFINAENSVRGALAVGFAQDFLAFQHYGEDEAGILGMIFVFFDEATKDFFGTESFRRVFRLVVDRRGEGGAPEREGNLSRFLQRLPALDAEITAEVAAGFRIWKKGRDDRFIMDEGTLSRGALTSTGTDMPRFSYSHGSGVV